MKLKTYRPAFFCLACMLASWQWAVAQKPDADALYVKGKSAYNNAQYEEAISLFTRVLGMDSSHVNAYLQRGFCHGMLKDYQSAIADYTNVIALQPDHKWAYVSRGSAWNKKEEYGKAIADFNHALELDPEDAETYNNRGFAKKSLGDKDGACADWIRSKKLGNAEAKIILKNNRCK